MFNPDLTNNSNWFLKPDLIVHPKYAVSERKPFVSFNLLSVTNRKMLNVRTDEAKVVMRSLCGSSDYYSRFKEELYVKNLPPVIKVKPAKKKSMFVGKRSLPAVFNSANEARISTSLRPQREVSTNLFLGQEDSILHSECDVLLNQDSYQVGTPRFDAVDPKSSKIEQACNKHRQSWSR